MIDPNIARRRTRLFVLTTLAAGALFATPSHAATTTIPMTLVTADGTGTPIGTVTVTDAAGGAVLTPALKDLPPGDHGFHLHDKGSCAPGPDPDKAGAAAAAFGAGGHFDPSKTGKHEGPQGTGHQGDLPFLSVAANGTATQPVTAPHLKVSDVAGHALMIHAGGDNYSDQPTKLGGGGGRIACGVAPA